MSLCTVINYIYSNTRYARRALPISILGIFRN